MRTEANEDNIKYFNFTGPQRLDKVIHTLEGILVGLSSDGKVSNPELKVLTHWLGEHEKFVERHPFNEIVPRLTEVMLDGIIDAEEIADILWLCNRLSTDERYFNKVTSDMQRLQGVMGGIAADGHIEIQELNALSDWIGAHEHLKTCWPYDELEALITDVVRDGVISDREHKTLLHFFAEFMERPGHRAIEPVDPEGELLIHGICAVCPEIRLMGNRFCFTGKSAKCSRKEFGKEIERHGGIFSERVTKDIDYLAVGAEGNPCWAYACYGRKVEQAVQYRRDGCKLLIVHEHDLWDAIADGH